jgi:hypothetical protein
MTDEQAAQIGDALARIATAVENIGRHIEEQRRPAPTAAVASSSITSASSRPAPRPARRPTPA